MPTERPAVVRLFDRLSTVYDAGALQAVVYRPPQDEILRELTRLRPRRVADVGCGTGILASRIAAELQPVFVCGCDPSPGMLDRARARSRDVRWLGCRSEALPYPDGAFDAVVSSHAFHFFDQPAALREFRRVLAPGGTLVVVLLNPVTPAGSRLVGLHTMGAARFPTRRQMYRLVRAAGFAGARQRRVRRRPLGPFSPDVVTVGWK